MANYPSLAQSVGSRCVIKDDLQIDRSSSGKAQARAFWTGKKRTFQVQHQLLTSTDLATLLSFYDSNRTTSFNFTWSGDGATYVCIFAGAPAVDPLAANFSKVAVNLEEV